MRHTETDILIDVHTRLAPDLSDPIVPVARVHEQSKQLEFHGTRVRMPPPLILVGHNIVHGQLNHEHYARKQIQLRQLLDFAILRSRYEQQIDWGELTGASAASAWDMCWRRTCDMTGRCSVSVCRPSAPRRESMPCAGCGTPWNFHW